MRRIALFTLVSGLLLSSWTQKSTSETYVEQKTISFNETLTLDTELIPAVEWTIIRTTTGSIIASGYGSSLADYIFTTPGSYHVELKDHTVHEHDDHEHHDCSHPHYPDLIELTVSPVRMTFDMSSVVLSREIVGGEETEGTELTVVAFVEIFDNYSVTFPHTTFRSAGVGTSIEGTLINPHPVLHEGLNIFTYELRGSAEGGNYIMFDFLDYNGHIQCYYMPTLIP